TVIPIGNPTLKSSPILVVPPLARVTNGKTAPKCPPSLSCARAAGAARHRPIAPITTGLMRFLTTDSICNMLLLLDEREIRESTDAYFGGGAAAGPASAARPVPIGGSRRTNPTGTRVSPLPAPSSAAVVNRH